MMGDRMKKYKFIIITFCIIAAGLFVGCDQLPTTDVPPIQLDTPTNIEIVSYDNNKIVFFDSVAYATKYQIRIFQADTNELVNAFFVTSSEKIQGILIDNLEIGEYKLSVKAFPNDESTILNSYESETISFTVMVQGGISDIKYNVVFDSDGGTTIVTKVVSKGDTVEKPADPTKTGYKFINWTLDGEEFDFNTLITKNITLKAVWEEDKGGVVIPPASLMSYYKEAEGLTGSALKTKLRSIISANTKSISYSSGLASSTTGLPYTDADPSNSNNIILFYGHVSVKNVVNTNWNREHVWPKSLGWFDKTGAGCDIHHIRPENISVNSTRGNYLMGEVTGGKAVTYPDGTIAGYVGSGKFEPNDVSKGDVARIYLYMMIRYSQTDSSYKVTNAIESVELLLKWHKEDPVDELEIIRNNRAYEVQGNRNPFIDYPEFAEMIFG